jgi:FemAB-related protein (PEP-CTERM system-associated)
MNESQLFTGSAAEWDAFVAAQADATAAHVYAWRRIVERVYGHDCPYLVTRAETGISGALPLVDVRSLPFGRFLVSMPYLSAGGPLGSDSAVQNLTQAAVSLAGQRRARLVEFRNVQLRSHHPAGNGNSSAPADAEKVSCALGLPDSTDALWSKLGGKLRSQIRRPQKEGIEVRFGPDQLDAFFRVFARNMRDLGSPPHPRRFFEVIRDELPGNGVGVWFGCAYLRGEPIAGGCALTWRGEVEMTWASALREHSALAPNMLLYWTFIERAISLGFNRFNFGRCTPGSGSHKFKLQWGASDEPLRWQRWPDHPTIATPRQDRGSMAMAARLWRHVPVPMANLIGARLRGGIPA